MVSTATAQRLSPPPRRTDIVYCAGTNFPNIGKKTEDKRRENLIANVSKPHVKAEQSVNLRFKLFLQPQSARDDAVKIRNPSICPYVT